MLFSVWTKANDFRWTRKTRIGNFPFVELLDWSLPATTSVFFFLPTWKLYIQFAVIRPFWIYSSPYLTLNLKVPTVRCQITKSKFVYQLTVNCTTWLQKNIIKLFNMFSVNWIRYSEQKHWKNFPLQNKTIWSVRLDITKLVFFNFLNVQSRLLYCTQYRKLSYWSSRI